MTSHELQAIKNSGLRTALLDSVTSKLWTSRKTLENIGLRDPNTFKENLRKVREALDDAEQLYDEADKIL